MALDRPRRCVARTNRTCGQEKGRLGPMTQTPPSRPNLAELIEVPRDRCSEGRQADARAHARYSASVLGLNPARCVLMTLLRLSALFAKKIPPSSVRAEQQSGTQHCRSVRNYAVKADIDAVGLERAIRLLGRGVDADGGARLERARVAHLILNDGRARRDQELLLAALVLDHYGQAVDTGHRVAGLTVRHGAVGRARPTVAVSVAGSALRLRKDVHLDRFLGAVGLRNGAAADVGALLDVGERGLGDAHDQRLVGEYHRLLGALFRLHQQRVAGDLLDRAAKALRLRLLRPCRRNRKRGHAGDTGQKSNPAHLFPPSDMFPGTCLLKRACRDVPAKSRDNQETWVPRTYVQGPEHPSQGRGPAAITAAGGFPFLPVSPRHPASPPAA